MLARIKNVDQDTYPCVFHHNGSDSLSRAGLELKRQFFHVIGEPNRSFHFSKNGRISGIQSYRRPRPAETIRKLPKLSIVTFTSYRFSGSAELSLHHLGIDIDVIRPSGRWRNIRKIGLMCRYLETVDTEYVLYIDSHDAFVTRDILGIVPAFEKLGCRMLIQADAHDWPESDVTRRFYDSIGSEYGPVRFLCGGIYMGEVQFVKRFFQRALETEPMLPNDDQGPYKLVFQELHPEAQLDYCCELFQPLTDYRDPRRPGRFEPVDLNLELRCHTDAESARDTQALARAKLLAAVPYFTGRLLDAAADRLGSWRRPG